MKQTSKIILLFLVCITVPAFAEDHLIKPGQNINDSSNLMKSTGYKETGLDIAPNRKDTNLRMWTVGEGVLILAFSTKSNEVMDVSYFLCDERPKAIGKTFEFSVTEFNPKARQMTIELPDN